MPYTSTIRIAYATTCCLLTGNLTLPYRATPSGPRALPARSVFSSLTPIHSRSRAVSLRRRSSRRRRSNEESMKKIIVGFASLMITLLPFEVAFAYGHANRYGGSTSHSYGQTSHTNAYGGSTSHAYGEGTSHSNVYGGSTSHGYYGGTSHTNAYGGTTSGAYGYGAAHTTPYGTTAYASAYHPPTAYYGYHPPTTVGYYGAGCYNCSSGSTAGAAALGAMVGVAVGAAAASSNTSAATSNAYSAGYSAGSSNTSAANANAAAANANVAAANANVTYEMGAVYGALPAGCITPSVSGGGTYYLCGNTWFSPSYGANGLYYRVVPTP